MSEIPPLSIPALLRQHGLRAKKHLGQNFLQDASALEKIARAAQVQSTDTVLEVGAGLGSLTRHLARRARQVVAIELDTRLIPILQTVLQPYANVRLVWGNALDFSPSELGLPPDYIVAANIPYPITSVLLRHLLEAEPRARRLVLTVQKEVAERICAVPPQMSLLALSVQFYGEPRIVARIPAAAFFPVPRVDSAVVCIEVHPMPRVPREALEGFFQLARAGFHQRRKTLRNALSAALGIPPGAAESMLRQAGIEPRRRAETLSLEEWARLSLSARSHVFQSPPVGVPKPQ